jgi:outer membrane protein OmpA-like peptidoglycan-associated protein
MPQIGRSVAQARKPIAKIVPPGAPSAALKPAAPRPAAVAMPPLRMSAPGDERESDASRRAGQVMEGPGAPTRAGESQGVQGAGAHMDVPSAERVLGSSGRALDPDLRAFFEPRFQYDFSQVRIHADGTAGQAAASLGAAAFTVGRHVAFGDGHYAPATIPGRALIAHELAHVTRQSAEGAPRLDRQLLLTGSATDIADFIAMAETASGLVLSRDPATNVVTAVASSATPATSPAFAAQLDRIMTAPTQNAEIHVGTHQANVDIGAFPVPADLTAGGVQNIDMDDINAMEAGAPGIGVADLAHELVENFDAHAAAPVAGVDRFGPAHAAGLVAEADVARDIVGSGNRVAQASMPIGTNITRIAEDYTNYYVLSTLTAAPATADFSRSNVSFATKVAVITLTIDSFITNDATVPAAGGLVLLAVQGLLIANPLATVLVEGFTDDQGSAASNVTLGQQRAQSAVASLVGFGVDGGRLHTVGRGATGFVAPNGTAAGRAQNRRVVLTVTRPGP